MLLAFAVLAAILLMALPRTPAVVRSLAGVLIFIELKTHWRYDYASDAFVVIVTLALIFGSRLLAALTNLLLMGGAFVLAALTKQQWPRRVIESSRSKPQWFWAPIAVWALSEGIIHA